MTVSKDHSGDKILIDNKPKTIQTKFVCNWYSSLRQEDFIGHFQQGLV